MEETVGFELLGRLDLRDERIVKSKLKNIFAGRVSRPTIGAD